MMPRTPAPKADVDHAANQLAAIERRTEELLVLIGDKRDAAAIKRREAKDHDHEADLRRDELNALNLMRAALAPTGEQAIA